VSVLVIRPTMTSSLDAAADPPEPLDPVELPPPQAASRREADRPVASRAARRPPGEMGFLTSGPLVFIDQALQQGGSERTVHVEQG
jgi:hypothetical protein